MSLTFAAIVVAFGTGTYVILSYTLMPAFEHLESEAAEADMARARQGLATLSDVVGQFATDWAQWDDAFDYMLDENPDFTEVNLRYETLTDAGFNLALLYDLNGELRWGKYISSGTGELSEFSTDIVSEEIIAAMLQHSAPLSEIDGMFLGPEGISLISSRPIVHSDRSGPVVGVLILGQLIDGNRVRQLRRMTEVDLTLMPHTSTRESSPATRSPDASGPGLHQATTEDLRVSLRFLNDVTGGRIATLAVRSPRSISRLGWDAVGSVMFSIALLGSAVIIGIWWLLHRLVVSRIGRLQQLMDEIQDGDDLSRRIRVSRKDEIGRLAVAFNSMIGKLEDSRRSYIEQSFKAGMAEVAVGVLHNIRNMLMPIVNDVAEAHDTARRPAGQNTARAIDEIRTGSAGPDRKLKLLQYLAAANDQIVEERDRIAVKLESATRQLDQVTKVLKDQEQFTHAAPVMESVNLADAIAEARDVLPRGDQPAVTVVVDDELDERSVQAHRVGLHQVLSNILLNAYESIKRTGRPQGRIDIRAGIEDTAGKKRVRITIRDTGAGIDSAALQRIFERGYTSKIDSFGGVGLHWSANALASMQGYIEASSAGIDRGAEFHITLQAA